MTIAVIPLPGMPMIAPGDDLAALLCDAVEQSRVGLKARDILCVCQKVVSSKQDARAWTNAARRSLDRMAVIAAGDVSIVLSDILSVPRDQLGSVVTESERLRRLLSFVLSPSYLELRKKLGMGVR